MHLGPQSNWTKNTKTGFEAMIYNEKGIAVPELNTDIQNLLENISILSSDIDYVIMAPTHLVLNLDFGPIIAAHKAYQHGITLVYARETNLKKTFLSAPIVTFDATKTVTNLVMNTGTKATGNAGLSTYLFDRQVLLDLLSQGALIPGITLDELLMQLVAKKTLNIKVFRHYGYVRCFETLEQYYFYSSELLENRYRQQLFSEERPFFTRTHDTPPSLYGAKAKVMNSFIANGATINGTVINSIISRNVTISEGAIVKNCILFTNTFIGPEVQISHLLSDKNVRIEGVKELNGQAQTPKYLKVGTNL
jgi:glucose-1-phosphate adenylyltransferase